MSASYNFQGILQPPQTTAVTTGGVDIANPTGGALHRVVGIRIANIDASNACRIGLYWTNASAADTQFFNDVIAADDSILIDDPIVFGARETVRKLRAVAQNNSDLIATVYFAVAAQKPEA